MDTVTLSFQHRLWSHLPSSLNMFIAVFPHPSKFQSAIMNCIPPVSKRAHQLLFSLLVLQTVPQFGSDCFLVIEPGKVTEQKYQWAMLYIFLCVFQGHVISASSFISDAQFDLFRKVMPVSSFPSFPFAINQPLYSARCSEAMRIPCIIDASCLHQ